MQQSFFFQKTMIFENCENALHTLKLSHTFENIL